MSMHTLLVGRHHLRPLPAISHDQILTVTSAARARNVAVVHPRLGVARRQQLVRTAVAIDTRGRLAVASLDRLGVEAAFISGLLVRVALCAGDSLGWSF